MLVGRRISNLVIATGADVKTAQALSRHSTPYLTMEVYGETVDMRLVTTANMVGDMLTQAGEGDAGECDGCDDEKWSNFAQALEITPPNKTATHCSAMGCHEKLGTGGWN